MVFVIILQGEYILNFLLFLYRIVIFVDEFILVVFLCIYKDGWINRREMLEVMRRGWCMIYVIYF